MPETTLPACLAELLLRFTSYGNAMYRNDPEAAERIAEQFNEALSGHAKLLRMFAHRARCFPVFPMGYHLPELFALLGEEQPSSQDGPQPAPAPLTDVTDLQDRVDACQGSLCMQRNRCSYTPCQSHAPKTASRQQDLADIGGKVRPLRQPRHDLGRLAADIKAVVMERRGAISVTEAIGALELVKLEIHQEQAHG